MISKIMDFWITKLCKEKQAERVRNRKNKPELQKNNKRDYKKKEKRRDPNETKNAIAEPRENFFEEGVEPKVLFREKGEKGVQY